MTTITKITNRPSIVKTSFEIYRLLTDRIAKLAITNTEIIEDAQSQGVHIYAGALSKYFNSFDIDKKEFKKEAVLGGLSEENILWLCERYGIKVNLRFDLTPFGMMPYKQDNKH